MATSTEQKHNDAAFKRIVAKLHKAELEHLRQVIEYQRQTIEILQDRAERAEEWAASWQSDFYDLSAQIMDSGQQIGMTKEGVIGIVGDAKVA